MFSFFFPSTARKLSILESLVDTQSKHVLSLIERIETLESKVESLEGEIAGIDDEIKEKVESEVEHVIDGLEVSISTSTRWR